MRNGTKGKREKKEGKEEKEEKGEFEEKGKEGKVSARGYLSDKFSSRYPDLCEEDRDMVRAMDDADLELIDLLYSLKAKPFVKSSPPPPTQHNPILRIKLNV
jgi:hypothetical protein